MKPSKLVIGRRLGRQSRLGTDSSQQLDAGAEPSRTQRMPRPEIVLERSRSEDEKRAAASHHSRIIAQPKAARPEFRANFGRWANFRPVGHVRRASAQPVGSLPGPRGYAAAMTDRETPPLMP